MRVYKIYIFFLVDCDSMKKFRGRSLEVGHPWCTRCGIGADTCVIDRSRHDIASLAENIVVVRHKPRLGRLGSSSVRQHNYLATENV